MSILVAGELNVDLILNGPNTRAIPGRESIAENLSITLGSASAICAAALAKLGNDVTFIGKRGDDDWGRLCVKTLDNLGIDSSPVICSSSLKTGVTVSISSPEDRALITYLGAISELEASDISDELLRRHRHLHVSSYFLQRALRPELPCLFDRARRLGLTTSVDPGFDPEEQWGGNLRELLLSTDVFFPNEVELAALSGIDEPADAIAALDNGHTLIVAKLGRKGCLAMKAGKLDSASAFPITPVDTTGAGDTFNAGFLHAWLSSRPLPEALRFAAACGALSTLGIGGIGNQPTLQQAQEFLASWSE